MTVLSRFRPARLVRRLLRDTRAVAVIELAICTPVLIALTLGLFELVNYAIVRQQISQLALQVADNAARIGAQTSLQTEIDEKEINDLFSGANLQAGSLDFANNGRIILSSLEVDPDPPHGQYIHWQRCYGSLAVASSYGRQGDGKGTNSLTGMGPANARITANSTAPAMFVEIVYRYRPLVTGVVTPGGPIREIATMMVRDNRDTSGAGVNPVAGVTPSTCP